MSVSAPDMDNYVDVAAVEEIPEGESRCYESDGRAVAIFCDDSTFYPVSDTCRHPNDGVSCDLYSGYGFQ